MAQIPVGPQVVQVWTGAGPVLLANQDTTNPVTVSDQRNFTMDAQNADVIPALGSIAYQGDRALYAMAPADTAALLVIAEGTAWSPGPPAGIQAFAQIGANQGGSPYTIHTFGASGRIWAAHLSFALSANASHTGNDQAFCTLKYSPPTGGDKIILVIEVAVGGASSTDSGDGDLTIPGMAVAMGGSLILDVNAGNAITNAIMRASTTTLVSFP